MINVQAKALLALAGLLFTVLLTNPAEARRFRIFGIPHFGGGSGESIDPVYDLPDEEPFIRNGNSIDVGYLHGNESSGYVLYHGTSYSRLDERGITLLSGALGFDPTA